MLTDHDVGSGLLGQLLEDDFPTRTVPLVELGMIGHREFDRVWHVADGAFVPGGDGVPVSTRQIANREVKAGFERLRIRRPPVRQWHLTGTIPPVGKITTDGVVHELQAAHACLQLGEHDQLHQLGFAQPPRLQVSKLVVDASLPAVQDVHRQVLETGDRQLDRIAGLGVRLLQSSSECAQALVKVACVVWSMIQHDGVRRRLVHQSPAAIHVQTVGAPGFDELLGFFGGKAADLRNIWSRVRFDHG